MIASLLSAVVLMLPPVPGAYNTVVRPWNVSQTVCRPGYSASVRPPTSYTSALKVKQLAQFRYADQNPTHYQEDHLVSLSLGGSPRSPRNLWPEPWRQARRTDRLESQWHRDLCAGRVGLRAVQRLEVRYKRSHG